MKNLRRSFARFCYRNQNKGIPNLMLYLAIGNLIVYFFSLADPSGSVYELLRFNGTKILHGQVWRLFSYVFTYLQDTTGLGLFLGLISMLCYYFMGKMLERQWGVLRFNLYYLTGVVLMDIAALLIGCSATTTYLNASLFLAIATIMPDARFLLFYIIPVKAKYLAWVDILLTAWGIVTSLLRCIGLGILTFRMTLFCLFPLLAVANYFLFFGKEAANLLPDFLRYRKTQTQKNFRSKAAPGPNPNWAGNYRSASGTRPYRHKCTVCGRTDTEYPNLEFRYCSRCKGYYCYCQDHINNHEHIQ